MKIKTIILEEAEQKCGEKSYGEPLEEQCNKVQIQVMMATPSTHAASTQSLMSFSEESVDLGIVCGGIHQGVVVEGFPAKRKCWSKVNNSRCSRSPTKTEHLELDRF
jgi:hypothetical protein